MERNQKLITAKHKKIKAILLKNFYKKSFYGILGVHPEAKESDIEKGFKIKVNEINCKKDIDQLLKAYATLKSSYKEQYDNYIKNYEIGISKLVEIVIDSGNNLDVLAQYESLFSDNMHNDTIFMQPWATNL